MRIRRARFDGVRGVPDGEVSFVDAATDRARSVVVVTGPGGAGKTRMLEALIAAKEDVGPYGPRPSAADWIRPGCAAAKIIVEWELDRGVVESETIFAHDVAPSLDHDEELVAALEAYAHDEHVPKVDYFPDTRSLGGGFGSSLRVADQRRARLGRDDRKYGAAARFVAEIGLGLHGARATEKFVERLARLASDVAFEGATRQGDRTELELRVRGEPIASLAELPRSRQQAVLFAASATLVGLDHAIVLVDEPELHQPSCEVLTFFDGLARLGEEAQLICATGSAAIAGAVAASAVARLEPARRRTRTLPSIGPVARARGAHAL